MSTFKVRIEDYVGAVGDDTFLGDALTDTASEVIRAIPDDKIKSFTQESGDITAASTNIANHRIVSVIRERGTDGEYVECREISVKYFRKAQDSSSMFSASVESPVYIIKNSSIHVFPTPGASPNAFKVESVIFPTIAASASDITDTPDSFPDSIEDIVVIGASAKACQYLMARVKDSMPSEPVLVLDNISVPSNPSISFINAGVGNGVGSAQDSITVAPTDASSTGATGSGDSAYSKPSLQGSSDELTDVTGGTFGSPSVDYATWWDTLSDIIETEEDSELATSQVAKIRSYIEAFNAEVNSAKSAMQATIEDARLSTQASIATGGNATQSSIANASNDVSASISKMRESTGAAIAQMGQSTNVNITNAAKTLEASIQDYSLEITRFGADIQRYSSEINTAINEYSTDIQKYTAQVDRYTKEYSWYQDQYVRLDAKFKESLQVLIAN
tara:strand:+ start:2537 stop:3880 length:1344 start_codon:yes stop_codon:yes gene_type:complete